MPGAAFFACRGRLQQAAPPADYRAMAPEPARRDGILRRACPRCGQAALLRVIEAAPPQALGRAGYGRVTHMRCSAEGCGFDGWVPRRTRRRQRARWLHGRLRRVLTGVRRWLPLLGGLVLAGAAAAGGAAIGSAWERAHAPSVVEQRAALPPGEYHDGDPLPAAHPLAQPKAREASPLDLRGACVWGRPGRQPYRGSVAEALAAARVPAAVKAELLARHAAKRPDGRLVIANDGIRDEQGRLRFAAQGFAMTYGHTLCLETRVNFPAGHTEPADLYEVRDESGRRWSMMVPDVCGNVSLIAEARPRKGAQGPVVAVEPMPAHLRLATLEGTSGADGARPVPVPGTLACLLAALLAWGAAATARRRPPPPEGP